MSLKTHFTFGHRATTRQTYGMMEGKGWQRTGVLMTEMATIGQLELKDGISGALADELAQLAVLGEDPEAPVPEIAVLGEIMRAGQLIQAVHVLAGDPWLVPTDGVGRTSGRRVPGVPGEGWCR